MPSFYDFSRTARELWAVHNAFRRLGFPADDLDMVPDTILDGKAGYAGMQAKQGDKTFVVSIPRPMTKEEFSDEWVRLCVQIASFEERELDAVWTTSWVRNNSVGLLVGLHAKGIKTSW